MIGRKTIWGGVAALIFSGAALAQVTAIRGEVLGEDGAPLKDAAIIIERKDMRGTYKTKTNKKGEYYYGGLGIGNYDISCEVNGVLQDKVNNVRTSMGDPRAVDFDLRKVKTRREEMAKAAATGRLSDAQARGMTPEQKAQFEKLNKERQEAISKNNQLNAAFNAGMQAEEAKQWDTAIESFKKASELDPKQDVVWAHLGDASFQSALTKTGEAREALIKSGSEAWNQALTLKPTPSYHNNFALALARAGKLPEALVELEKAAALDPPGAGKYYYNLGALLINNGKSDDAAVYFKKAIEATPDYAEAHYQYAMCLANKLTYTPDGKVVPPPGMKDELEAYLKLAPTGPNAEGAKAMLASFDQSVQTKYTNPTAPPPAKKPATRKK